MNQSPDTATPPNGPRLGLGDAISIIVGIVVGASIYKVPSLVFSNVQHAWQGLGTWILGGLLSLAGALCFAELAATYPRSGGGYVYLSQAFGRWLGFLFGWSQLVAILTGSIAAVAYVFGDYSAELFRLDPGWSPFFAVGAVAGLSAINVAGVYQGKLTQNILTIAKVFGLSFILLTAFLFPLDGGQTAGQAKNVDSANFGFAMILVLYAFGGWNDAAFVTAEVRDPQRNLPRALVSGILLVTVLYVLVNLGYLRILGIEALRSSPTPASDALELAWGPIGAKLVCLLAMISTLGAVNGMVLAGARIYATCGQDHPLMGLLARRGQRFRTPVLSLVIQGLISILMILVVGTETGRIAVDRLLTRILLQPLPWEKFHGGFELLLSTTAPCFWLFFLLTGISLFWLRFKEPDRKRPFRVPLYPIVPACFCGTSAYMLWASCEYAERLVVLCLVPVLAGIPLWLLSELLRKTGSRTV